MAKIEFKARVQYNDMIGSAAADHADEQSPRSHLIALGLMSDDEALVGLSFGFWENGAESVEKIGVLALIAADANSIREKLQQKSVAVRTVEFQIDPREFFGLFKRLDVAMKPAGAQFTHYETKED